MLCGPHGSPGPLTHAGCPNLKVKVHSSLTIRAHCIYFYHSAYTLLQILIFDIDLSVSWFNRFMSFHFIKKKKRIQNHIASFFNRREVPSKCLVSEAMLECVIPSATWQSVNTSEIIIQVLDCQVADLPVPETLFWNFQILWFPGIHEEFVPGLPQILKSAHARVAYKKWWSTVLPLVLQVPPDPINSSSKSMPGATADTGYRGQTVIQDQAVCFSQGTHS